jgi:thiol-disulfide isomerase/thioredoxin
MDTLKKNWLLVALLVVGASVWLGRQLYMAPKLGLGSAADDFSAPLVGGGELRLSSLRGKVVLLDFWASWCGPCRRDNPALVRIWEEFSEKNFAIVSVSLDTKRPAWEKAIREDGLRWPLHVSHLMGFDDPVAGQYRVRSIPTKYLLSEDGSVIAVNPDENKIREVLQRRLQ